MDKHVNNPIATHSTEEQLDWVDQCKPGSPTPFSQGAGARHNTLVLGETRTGKTRLSVAIIDSISHGGQSHE